jgi:hypothetical protein
VVDFFKEVYMSTKAEKPSEFFTDIKPNKLLGIGMAYSKEGFMMAMQYSSAEGEPANTDKIAVTFSPEFIQDIIKLLFESGKVYQKQFGTDIGFGDFEEE